MKLKKENWSLYKNNQTYLYTISDPNNNFLVQISDFGATIVRVMMADREGHLEDINFGQDSPEEYIKQGGYLGAVIGRVANRIGNAKFELDGKTYNLFINNCNVHSLHGGREGFNFKIWNCLKAEADDEKAILEFQYISPDGEENYPGTLTTNLKYIIKPMEIEWEFISKTDKPTIVNLTNHAYWNLEGLQTVIDSQILRLAADRYMPSDETLIPTGEVINVENTGYDFREGKKFADIFKEVGDIDNNFFITDYNKEEYKLRFAAELFSPKTGRKMSVFTTEPCIQVYTGNFMADIKSFGIQCKKHSAVCLETQRVPNAINFPEFREMVILRPGEIYKHKTLHKFEVSKFVEE
ncbi:MAG: aldose epimerase family protein [Promethearchaeota archaeon]